MSGLSSTTKRILHKSPPSTFPHPPAHPILSTLNSEMEINGVQSSEDGIGCPFAGVLTNFAHAVLSLHGMYLSMSNCIYTLECTCSRVQSVHAATTLTTFTDDWKLPLQCKSLSSFIDYSTRFHVNFNVNLSYLLTTVHVFT